LVLLNPKEPDQSGESLDAQELASVEEKEESKEISFSTKVIAFIVSFAVFLGIWQLVASASGNSLIVAGPESVFFALISLLQNNIPLIARGSESANSAILETLEVIALGFGFAVAVGVPLGIAAGRWKSFESIIDPWLGVIYTVPIVAIVPAIYYGIGTSFVADILITFLFAVFPIIINTENGVRYMSNSLAEVGRTFGASESQFIAKIVVPAAAPDIVTGLRIGIGRAILGAVLAEALLGETGLGGMMMIFQATFSTSYMMAAVVLIAVMGILVLQMPKILEHRFFKWKETERLSREL
jgi:ABC-type nitrate/sulfonate/bicarbonate transport system permease component